MSKCERIAFDCSIYRIDAVKKAAYKFMNVVSADITAETTAIKCDLYFSDDQSVEAVESIIADFRKEVLDQDLREHLKKETEQVRNLILAHAFSKTGFVGNE